MSDYRVFLVGESNPYGSNPYYALYPLPAHATGGRLAKVLGLAADEYLDRFERRNLLVGSRWSVPEARRAAVALLRELDTCDRLVLLGARVAAAFGVPFRENLCAVWWLEVGHDHRRPRWTLVLPHPSGRSREWNDPEMRGRVRAAVVQIQRPEVELPDGVFASHLRAKCVAPLEEQANRTEVYPAQVSDLSEGDRSEVDRFTKWIAARARWTAGEMSADEFAAVERELYPDGLGGA